MEVEKAESKAKQRLSIAAEIFCSWEISRKSTWITGEAREDVGQRSSKTHQSPGMMNRRESVN